MIRQAIIALSLVLGLNTVEAQEEFVMRGHLDLPDGTEIGVSGNTLADGPVEIESTVLKDGAFELRGHVKAPAQATFMTNNLKLVEQNQWPMDSIDWNYIEFYVANDNYTIGPDLQIHGGTIQSDFRIYEAQGGREGDGWKFISEHPTSVVSAQLAYSLLQRGYNLTAEEVARLKSTITSVPDDPTTFALLQKSLAAGAATVQGAPVVDLEVKDVEGNISNLKDLAVKGKYTLLDFWASWCGICLYQMPDTRKLYDQYQDKFTVVAISIDTKDDAWRKAMEKHPEPWPQYCTTEKGYQQMADVLQVSNGVPYYILVGPDGRVVKAVDGPDELATILKDNIGK